MKFFLLATRNAHKVEELQALLGGSVQLRSINGYDLPELPETGRTFEANAEQKARYVYEATGLPCLADDSGLEVDALGGEPGVDSAHYSGGRDDAANLALVLEKLKGATDRSARFRCMLALVDGPGKAHLFSGACEGRMAEAARGKGGFGYDPAFIPDGEERTFSEMSAQEKNARSHRARAAGKLRAWLAAR